MHLRERTKTGAVNLSQFNRILLQVFLLPVVALLLMAGALYWQIGGANVTVNRIQEADAFIAQTTLVGKLTIDEESGLRGYETTSDTRFLQPFVDAEARLQNGVPAGWSRWPVDADQKRLIADLRSKHQTWRDAFALPIIATVRAGGQTSDVDLNLQGKSLMDDVRADIVAIIQSAGRHRSERIALWHQQVRHMLVVLLLLALGMGVLIGLFTRSRLHAVSNAYKTSLDVLKRRAEEIFESEQKLRTTLDSIGDGVITCDAEGRVQMMNPVAQELTGWKQADASRTAS